MAYPDFWSITEEQNHSDAICRFRLILSISDQTGDIVLLKKLCRYQDYNNCLVPWVLNKNL